eukprot:TRINITY_DN4054_c0_g1_i2.p1 TRINITY_DN4054_c0_g1~~TRINITY_DN4054_c0_g1_i2.p1  ORF type:complete len:711 (-),score=177.41 TRINITY_DN4054_c0_g1_i2:1487-3619(-)
MAEDNMDADESMDVDIGGPETPVLKRRRSGVKDTFKKTTFLSQPVPSPDDLIIPIKPYDQREKFDPSAFPMDMINKIVENSRKHVEATRAAVQAEREKGQKERALAQRDILKKEEAQIQQQIEEVKRQIAEKEAARSAEGPDRPGTPGLNTSTETASLIPDGLSELKQEIINLRVRLQQLQFAEYERRENQKKVKLIWEVHPHVTEEEALRALKECSNDEDEAISQLTDWSWLHQLRHKIAKEKTPPGEEDDDSKSKRKKPKKAGAATKGKRTGAAKKVSAPVDSSQPAASSSVSVPASTNAPGSADAAAAPTPVEGVGSGVSGDSEGEGDLETRSFKKKKKVQVPKLRLDDAVAQATQQGSMEGWSQARVRAWKLRDSNPNAYYYRFNDPGEEQRNGKWTEDEKKAFFKRMAEVGVNGQWGIFAKEIHGRVGYQCANFYRQLIESGEIKDDRYVVDESGKAHFLFSKGIIKKGKNKGGGDEAGQELAETAAVVDATGQPLVSPDGAEPPPKKKRKVEGAPKKTSAKKHAPAAPEAAPPSLPQESSAISTSAIVSSSTGMSAPAAAPVDPPAETGKKRATPKKTAGAKKAGNKKKRKKKDEDDGDDFDDDYKPSSKTADALNEEVEAKKAKMREENPLPDMRDAITQEELLQPAISPYGHVLSYSTWMTILMKDPKNTCPFTKQPLKKRDLVVLSWDNISEYHDKIIQPQ